MSISDWLLIAIVLLVASVAWLDIRKLKRTDPSPTHDHLGRVRDDVIARIQADFERNQLSQEYDLPDELRGVRAYIYWQLMSPWFKQLDAKYRYDTKASRLLREDWCDYIAALSTYGTTTWLELNEHDLQRKDMYEERTHALRTRLSTIEDAFATAIGPEGLNSLEHVRIQSYDAFDRTGKLPIAPEGHHYFPVSINPYVEQCIPRRSM